MSEDFRPVVVMPTYNNARTLPDILRRVEALALPMIVVNDGSTDGTAEILKRASATVVTHPSNRGKAAALCSGFASAAAQNFTHAATIDTDGQLDPEQIPQLLELARANPRALVLGYRDDTADDYPARSRFGRRFSNALVRLESGARVRDTQCGLRVYPLEIVGKLKCRAGHFGFETEIITRAGWAGVEFVESPVRCRYLPPGERVTHFKPLRDSLRALAMHARLLACAFAPWPITRPTWKSFRRWISPIEAWRQARGDRANRNWFAAGFAAGVFIANLPIYGLQTLLALYTAKKFHLHPLAVVAGSHVSTPPINLALIAAAIATGHLVLHGGWPRDFHAARLIGDWIVGAMIIGIATASIAFMIVSKVLTSAD